MPNRRQFIGTVGAAVAASLARLRAAGPYRVGVESYCFHDVDLAATIAHTTGLGLEYIELHDGHLPYTASRDELLSARGSLRAAGVTPEGVYIHDAFEAGDVSGARAIFEYARTMGFGYINGGPKREALGLLGPLVAEYGVDVTLHNHGPKARYETIEDVTSALEAHPNIKACVDIGHFARSRVDPVRAVRAIGRRCRAIHIKDVDAAGGNTVLGAGTIDLPGVFAAMAETGFDGLVVLEYEGDFDDMGRRLEGVRASLAVMERLIGRNR